MKRMALILTAATLLLVPAQARSAPEKLRVTWDPDRGLASHPQLRPPLNDCSPPAHIKEAEKTIEVRMSKADLPPQLRADDLSVADCIKQLASKKSCRIGDIVVVNGEGTVSQRGRCERDPKTDKDGNPTKAYAITGSYLNLGLNQPLKEIPNYASKFNIVVMFSTFKMTSGNAPPGTPQGCPLAWHSQLATGGKQIMNIQGVGRPYNPGPPGQALHAYTNMWSVQDWTEDEWVGKEDVTPLNILTHETEHDVCCFISHLEDKGGAKVVSRDLIGQQGAHWSLYHNTYGQLMYGANWREEGNGTFYSITPARGMRPLDLYLWGLIPPEKVSPVFRVDTKSQSCTPTQKTLDAIAKDCADTKNPVQCKTQADCSTGLCPGGTVVSPVKACTKDTGCSTGQYCGAAISGASKGKKVCHKYGQCSMDLKSFDLCLEPPYYRTISGGCGVYNATVVQSPSRIRAKGTKKWTKLDQIVSAVGKRWPDYKDSAKTDYQLFVLMTGGGTTVTQKDIDTLNRFRIDFARHMYTVTGYRLRQVTTYNLDDDTGLWEWGGVPEWKASDELEGWVGVNLAQPLAVAKAGGKVQLTLKDSSSGMTHSKLRLKGSLYDAILIKMTVPRPKNPTTGKAGEPKLVQGKLTLTGSDGKNVDLAFPVYADGQEHSIGIHPPHKLLKAQTCKQGCIALCKSVEDEKQDPKKVFTNEEWRDSCTGALLKTTWTKNACTSTKHRTACGPYCSGPRDPVLGASATEGWYDSCITQLTDTYHTATIVPVTDAAVAASLSGPVEVDRVDFFRVARQLEKDSEIKDGEKDWDGDGLINAYDNCPKVANPKQVDGNNDKHGDACDDFDSDGVANALDNCPTRINTLQADEDGDKIGDVCDPDFDEGCNMGGTPAGGPAGLALAALLLLALRRRRG